MDDKTKVIENGVECTPYPGSGVVDDTGKFRLLTADEKADRTATESLYTEAMAAHSPISLRPHPATKQFVLFFGNRASCMIPIGSVYTPGTVTVMSAQDLKETPFVMELKMEIGDL